MVTQESRLKYDKTVYKNDGWYVIWMHSWYQSNLQRCFSYSNIFYEQRSLQNSNYYILFKLKHAKMLDLIASDVLHFSNMDEI